MPSPDFQPTGKSAAARDDAPRERPADAVGFEPTWLPVVAAGPGTGPLRRDAVASPPPCATGAVPDVLRRSVPVISPADPLGGEQVPAAVMDVLRRSRGQGNPLPADVGSGMSQQFGMDLSAVRIHRDQDADNLTRSVQATAFTHGSDIYFSQASYAPGSTGRRRLLAHELAHVTAGEQQGTPGAAVIGRASDPAETHADQTADRVMAGLSTDNAADTPTAPPATPPGAARDAAPIARTIRRERNTSLASPRGGVPTLRRLLSGDELAEAGELAADGRYDDKLSMAFYREVERRRQEVTDGATDAAFREVIVPYVTEKVIAYLKDMWKGAVSGNNLLLNASNKAAGGAIEKKVKALESQKAPSGSATEVYANLQLEAAAKGSAWDKSLMTSDVALAIRQAAADLGIEKTAIKQEELKNALDEAHRDLRRAVEAGVRSVEDDEKPYYMDLHGKGSSGIVLSTKLGAYDPKSPDDDVETQIRAQLDQMRKGISSETLTPVFNDVVAAATEKADANAAALKDPTYATAKQAFEKRDISERQSLVGEATREAYAAIKNDEGDLSAQAAKVVTEGYIHSGLATAAPIIEKLASKPDSNGKLTITVNVPVKGAVIGFEFSCKVARDDSDVLSVAVELGTSAGLGIANVIKMAIGAGVYLNAKSATGATALMDQVSMAFYRRFKDAGVPYTDYLWGLAGKTIKKGESKDQAAGREAAAFAAMVEEQMGEKGEVETGGFVKGSAEADAGMLQAGIEAVGRSGTLLNKRAFTETKDRKAATSGFTVSLSASMAPFSGMLTASIRNVTMPGSGGAGTVETTGSFGASLTGKVPGGAIFGSAAQTGVQIATWIAQLVPKVNRIKQLIAQKDPGLGDVLMAKSLASQLQEAANAAKAGVSGDWSKKVAEFAADSKTAGLTASSSGVTFGFAYAADKEGVGTGTLYLDLASGTTINTGVAKISYTSGERLWSHELGKG